MVDNAPFLRYHMDVDEHSKRMALPMSRKISDDEPRIQEASEAWQRDEEDYEQEIRLD